MQVREKIFILLAILPGMFSIATGQYVNNPSFEAEPGVHRPPPGWYSCEEQSTPDVHGMNGMLPGISQLIHLVDHSPSHGQTYVLLKLRGPDYIGLPNTREQVSSRLLEPLEAGNCYVLHIDLSFEEELLMNSATDYNIAYPAMLEIWGGTDSCGQTELLARSPLVDNYNWKTYHLQVVPTRDYAFITLAPNWNVEDTAFTYNGVMLLDNVNIELASADTTYPQAEYNYYFKRYKDVILNPHALRPTTGVEYEWYPSVGLSCDDCENPVVTDYLEKVYFVKITDEYGCVSYEKFNIHYTCDSAYINYNLLVLDTIVGRKHQVELTASESPTYAWSPVSLVDCIDCQTTRILESMGGSFYAKVVDKQGCGYTEEFILRVANCDTIIENAVVARLDTIIQVGESVLLSASGSTTEYAWNKPADLSCDNCRETFATPKYSSVYYTSISDIYDCSYREEFRINVEISIPNVITPNNDGKNDIFCIPGLAPGCKMTIISRDGKLIFQENNYKNNWHARDQNGNKVQGGTYWYTLEFPETEEIHKGFIYVMW